MLRLLPVVAAVLTVVSGADERCFASLEGAKGEGCVERGRPGHDGAQELHLREGQRARHGPAWGAGDLSIIVSLCFINIFSFLCPCFDMRLSLQMYCLLFLCHVQ